MTRKGHASTIKEPLSKQKGRDIKFYGFRKKRGPVANTSHIPWMVWPKGMPGHREISPAHYSWEIE